MPKQENECSQCGFDFDEEGDTYICRHCGFSKPKVSKVRFILEGELRTTTAKELVKFNEEGIAGKAFKCYKEAKEFPYGEYTIKPDKPFSITVEIVKVKDNAT